MNLGNHEIRNFHKFNQNINNIQNNKYDSNAIINEEKQSTIQNNSCLEIFDSIHLNNYQKNQQAKSGKDKDFIIADLKS